MTEEEIEQALEPCLIHEAVQAQRRLARNMFMAHATPRTLRALDMIKQGMSNDDINRVLGCGYEFLHKCRKHAAPVPA